MLDLKKQSWLTVCGFVAGFASRKLFEIFHQYQNVGDVSFIDLDSIVYGLMVMVLMGLAIASMLNYGKVAHPIVKRKLRSAAKRKNKSFWNMVAWIYGYYRFQKSAILFSIAIFVIVLIATDKALIALLAVLLLPILGLAVVATDDSDSPNMDKFFQFFEIDTVPGAVIIVLTFISIAPGTYILGFVSQTFGGGRPEWVEIRLDPKTVEDTTVQRKFDNKPIFLLYRQGNIFWFKVSKDSTKIAFRRDQIEYFKSVFKFDM